MLDNNDKNYHIHVMLLMWTYFSFLYISFLAPYSTSCLFCFIMFNNVNIVFTKEIVDVYAGYVFFCDVVTFIFQTSHQSFNMGNHLFSRPSIRCLQHLKLCARTLNKNSSFMCDVKAN